MNICTSHNERGSRTRARVRSERPLPTRVHVHNPKLCVSLSPPFLFRVRLRQKLLSTTGIYPFVRLMAFASLLALAPALVQLAGPAVAPKALRAAPTMQMGNALPLGYGGSVETGTMGLPYEEADAVDSVTGGGKLDARRNHVSPSCSH